MPSQTDKFVIITGSNTGIGFEMAKAFAAKDAFVMLACRNGEKANNAKGRILEQYPNSKIDNITLNLASLKSVQKFSDEISTKTNCVDILINNAGVMMPPKSETDDGFELQIGTNYLGHFALTGHLMPLLESTEGSRVINLASLAHKSGRINIEDFNWKNKKYRRWKTYAQSKLACLMFALELQRRLSDSGSNIISLASHPGLCGTELGRHMPIGMRFGFRIIGQPSWKGALPTLYAATMSDAIEYPYWGPRGIAESIGYPKRSKIKRKALDEQTASELWKLSEKLTGVSYLS